MITKRFMYVSIGLLALTIAYQVGASTARGQAIGFRVIGSGTVVVGESVYHLDTANYPEGWKLMPYSSFTLPPVPASSLVNYSSGFLAITDTGEGWGKVGGVWTDLGPIPGTPVENTTWGELKARYAR